MWWHLATGRWIVEHREGLRVDVFSSTATGEPYALGEWLGDVVLFGAYAAAGWTGVATARSALVALAAFAVTRLALRSAPARVAIPIAVLAVVLSKPLWTDRPQLFTLALFPVVLELCLAARAGSRGALVASVPLVALWANLHSGYALGVVTLWVFALEAVLERRPAAARIAAAFVTSAVVSVEPGALSLLRAFGHVVGSTVRVAEESPVDPLTPLGMLFALFVGTALVVLMLRGGTLLGVMVMVPMLWLALTAQKHVPLFAFAAVPFIAGPLSALADEVGTTLTKWWWSARSGEGSGSHQAMYVIPYQVGTDPCQVGTETHTAPREVGGAPVAGAIAVPPFTPGSFPLVLAGALWLGAFASVALADPRPDLRPYPTGALAPLEGSSGILLNEFDWGGYLIWTVPSRPVFVDSRLYPFAGNSVMRSYEQAIHVLPGWRAVVERWNVSQALLRPERALAEALRDEGWTVRAHGTGFVLLERPR
jgi:hypothetical protein